MYLFIIKATSMLLSNDEYVNYVIYFRGYITVDARIKRTL